MQIWPIEKKEEAKFVKKIFKEFGIMSVKLNLMGNKGWPDRVFLLAGGKPAFIEFKRKGQTPYPLQEWRIQYLKALGYNVIWTDDYEHAYNWLSRLQATQISERSNKANDPTRGGGALTRPRPRKD